MAYKCDWHLGDFSIMKIILSYIVVVVFDVVRRRHGEQNVYESIHISNWQTFRLQAPVLHHYFQVKDNSHYR